MIFVLGISLIIVDSLYLFNLVKKEGFLGDDENDASNNLLENDENDASNNLLENDASNNLLKPINNETFTNTINEESDEETNYVHDKSTIKKLKQLNPNMIDTISKMNSVHIKEINKTINNLRDNIDP
jgi:hypothetical protein